MPFAGGSLGAHDDGKHAGSAKRNTVNGVAGLDGSGNIIDTSGNSAQTTNLKNVGSGYAGLDANILLSAAQLPPATEQHHNHYGFAGSAFETNSTAGNGTLADDSPNHEIDITTGITVVGRAVRYMKPSYTLSAKPLVFSAILRNVVVGVPGTHQKFTIVGLKNNIISSVLDDAIVFKQMDEGDWYVQTFNGGVGALDIISGGIADGSRLTIVATTSRVIYLVNGVVVASHTTGIPDAAMNPICGVYADQAGLTTARSCSIDYIGLTRYG